MNTKFIHNNIYIFSRKPSPAYRKNFAGFTLEYRMKAIKRIEKLITLVKISPHHLALTPYQKNELLPKHPKKHAKSRHLHEARP